MVKPIDKDAAIWVRQIVVELKNEYRELIYPISILRFEEFQNDELQEGFSTDGINVFYHPEYILEHRKEELKVQLLHIVLHGLLGHFEIKDQYEHELYRNFMMDMQVEYVLMKMLNGYTYDRKNLWNKLNAYVQGDCSMSIYRRLCEEKISTTCIDYYYSILKVDNHEMWDKGCERKQSNECKELWIGMRGKMLEGSQNVGFEDDLRDNIADIMTIDEKMFRTEGGTCVNYKELLEKFTCTNETNKEEPQSIDIMLYQYGLELYGDVPLIEPVEEVVNNVNVLAIAVDVSGSCINDETMTFFWKETYECLRCMKNSYREGEVIIFQCDDAIRQEYKIDFAEQNEIPTEIKVYGGGGTSFIPVFDKLDNLEQIGKKIDGLIYLTDGWGEYPDVKPDYPVYFVLESRQAMQGRVPEWINTVSLH